MFFSWWWRSKLQYIQTMESYSSCKRTRLPIHSTTWMNLKRIMPPERSLTAKATYFMIPCAQETFRKNKTDQWLPRVWHREQACLQGSTRGLFREKGLFCTLILVVVVTYIILSKLLRQAEELPCRKLRGSRAAVRLKARGKETRRDRRQVQWQPRMGREKPDLCNYRGPYRNTQFSSEKWMFYPHLSWS